MDYRVFMIGFLVMQFSNTNPFASVYFPENVLSFPPIHQPAYDRHL